MEFTESLKMNYEFRRLYQRGKSAVQPCLVIYCRRNGREGNRLGITVSNKLGNAVTRNRVRRRLREIYRLSEGTLLRGQDLVIVARNRAAAAAYPALERDFRAAVSALGLVRKEPGT